MDELEFELERFQEQFQSNLRQQHTIKGELASKNREYVFVNKRKKVPKKNFFSGINTNHT